jgi:hypothetical protein
MMPRFKQGWVGMELVKPEGQVGGREGEREKECDVGKVFGNSGRWRG